VKLKEVQQLTEATRQEQANTRASQQFNSTVISQLIAGIDQGLKNGTIVSAKPAQSTAAPTNWPSGTNTWTASNQQTPAQIRQQKQAAAAKTAQSQMAKNSAAPTATAAPETPEQKRIRLQKAATQTARTGMTPKPAAPQPAAPQFKGPKVNGLQVRNMGEGKKFNRLNRIFENLVNINELAGAPTQSISQYIQAQLPIITKSKLFNTSPYKESIAKIADEVESTYAKDKGQSALNKLADFSWGALTEKNPLKGQGGVSAQTAQNQLAPNSVTQTAPETPEQERQSKIGVKQINKIIPTLRKRDLLSVKKNIDNTLTSRGSATAATNTPAPGNNAFGQMAGQLSGANTSKSSTGGTTTTTPTGRVHTAAKTNASAQSTETPPAADNTVRMPKGKVRAAREGGVTPEEQAKFDEKVKQAMANQK
jgi:hypothetical protein